MKIHRNLLTTATAITAMGAFSMAHKPVLAAGEAPARAQNTQSAAAPASKGFLLQTIRHNEKEYRYVLYVPPDYDPARPWPAILFLHGAGECGHDGLKSVAVGLGPALMLGSQHWPFLVLIPQKPAVAETWAQHDGLLMAMLDLVKKGYNVDAGRLYLTGLSQGGYGTWAIGAMHPDLFAAIAPVCGGGKPDTASALKNMPIWAFHGEDDKTVPPGRSEEMVKAVKEAGGDATLTIYPGVGHNSWDKAYRDEKLYDWFLKHRREQKSFR